MTKIEVRLAQLIEMAEVIETEFYTPDGSCFNEDPARYSAQGMATWLDEANEAGGFRWTQNSIWAMANSLQNLK